MEVNAKNLLDESAKYPQISGFDSTKIFEVRRAVESSLFEFKKEQEQKVEETTQSINKLTESMSTLETEGLSTENLNNLENSFNESKKYLDEENQRKVQELIDAGKKQLEDQEVERKTNIEKEDNGFGDMINSR